MLAWIMSDIHLESTGGRWDLPAPHARPTFDVLIVAGDLIPRMERGVAFLAERVTDKPVLYLPGNHEGYGCDLDRTVAKARAVAAGTSVRVMQDDMLKIGNTTFVAATLWTDFELFGNADHAMRVAGDKMNDYKKIRQDMYRRRLRPADTRARHFKSRAFFESEMRKPRSGPLVAISHHAPHPHAELSATNGRGLSSDEVLTAAYRSDLTRLMMPAPDDGRGPLVPADLWVFGHTHESVDVKIGATRLVSKACMRPNLSTLASVAGRLRACQVGVRSARLRIAPRRRVQGDRAVDVGFDGAMMSLASSGGVRLHLDAMPA